MNRCRIKVTITKIFKAEFEDTHAASRMYRTLERGQNVAVLTGMSGEGWTVKQENESHSVEPAE